MRNFVRNQPLFSCIWISVLLFLLLFSSGFIGEETLSLSDNVDQPLIHSPPADTFVKPTFPSRLKAETMYEAVVAEEEARNSGTEPQLGPLEINSAGHCIHPKGGEELPADGTELIVYEGCVGEKRLQWEFTSEGKWLHGSSDKCVEADGGKLSLQTTCTARYTIEKGKITHTQSGKCVNSRPHKDAKIELTDSCEHSFWQIALFVPNRRKELPKPTFVKERIEKVAISTLIMKDPAHAESSGFLDSAAVLVMSIRAAKLSYDYDLIAIVSKKVQTARPILRKLGFKIIEKELPMQPEEIRNEQVREEMLNDGCCGMDELLKLHAWRMFEYDRVLQIDADILFHKNFDELFEYDATLVWTHGALGGSEPLNGGFLVIRPSQEDYDEMVEIIKEGDFQPGRGWRGVCCWVYGGRTIQGILPYYYIHHKKVRNHEVERCQYNNMVEIDRCKTWNYDHVTSNHFTVCQKPFSCSRYNERRFPLCGNFTKKWWEFSSQLEDELGLPHRPQCQRGRYTAIDWSEAGDLQSK